jgi:hypothetical protein
VSLARAICVWQWPRSVPFFQGLDHREQEVLGLITHLPYIAASIMSGHITTSFLAVEEKTAYCSALFLAFLKVGSGHKHKGKDTCENCGSPVDVLFLELDGFFDMLYEPFLPWKNLPLPLLPPVPQFRKRLPNGRFHRPTGQTRSTLIFNLFGGEWWGGDCEGWRG